MWWAGVGGRWEGFAGFVCEVDAAKQLDTGQQADGRQAGRPTLAADEGQIKGAHAPLIKGCECAGFLQQDQFLLSNIHTFGRHRRKSFACVAVPQRRQ